MALTLVSEAGSATANAYCTLASADEYIERNIHAYSAWSSAATADRNACIVRATELLDVLATWVGAKSDPLGIDPINQALDWPRENVYDENGDAIDEDTIPRFMVHATAEYARFLRVVDRTADSDTYGFKRIKAGPIELDIDKNDRAPAIPTTVWSIISYYAMRATGRQRTLERA